MCFINNFWKEHHILVQQHMCWIRYISIHSLGACAQNILFTITGSKNSSFKWLLRQVFYLNTNLYFMKIILKQIYRSKWKQEILLQGVILQKREVDSYVHLLCISRLPDERFDRAELPLQPKKGHIAKIKKREREKE